ncbi:MAG TPA: divalent metal cation transporter [Pyrinomonadaceae bacterium]|nr:divalent metal cation transporter [Pyrinomonadaceae bacterium]
MKSKAMEITLGIVTSVGGFLDVGAIATAVQAGAAFRFQLLWVIALGTVCVIFLVEMSGRLAAVSHHTLVDALRERFGVNFYLIPFIAELLIDFLVLAAEIGGVCLALQLVTGINFHWWALPVAFVLWLLLWKGTFSIIENGTSFFGLVTLCFVVAVFVLHPPWKEVAAGVVPSLPGHDRAHYWFIAVAILGALISPYLFYFYSSGAIEDKWDKSKLGVNRGVAALGMSFGSLVSIGVLLVSALVLFPRGIQVDRYEQAAMILTEPFGYWGFILFAASLGIACFGAALEVSLDQAYVVAQTLGWNWGENQHPKEDARFSLTYTVFIFAAAILMVIGIDPLKLTIFTMALTAVVLPLVIMPLLLLMNDENYLGEHRNGIVGNSVVIIITMLAFVLAVVAIPLEIFGG